VLNNIRTAMLKAVFGDHVTLPVYPAAAPRTAHAEDRPLLTFHLNPPVV
jgi:hypothetical protein